MSNSMYEEMMQMQANYQRKLDELESENRDLRKQNLLLRGGRSAASLKKTKVCTNITITIFWFFFFF